MRRKQFIYDLSQLFAIAEYDSQPDPQPKSHSKSHAGHCSFTHADSNPYRQQYRAESG